MSDEVKFFLSELQSEVEGRAFGSDGAAPDFKENVFTTYVMDMLASEVGIVESPETCHFVGEVERGRAKINGFAIGEDAQDEESIDLFVSVYKGLTEVMRVPAEEMRRAAEAAIRFFRGALGNLYESLDPSQAKYQMAKRIHEAGPKLRRARLFILTDGQSDLARQKSGTVEIKGRDIPLKVEFWDIERLSRVIGSGAPQADIEIDVAAMNGSPLPCLTTPAGDGEYRAYVMILPGTLLFNLYNEHGAALLQRNVRSFLQAKGKVNRGIRETLKNLPGRFLAYNNGISMTADSVETQGEGDSLAITRIKGLQIVNGGQTTVSIHRARKFDRLDISGVSVQAKLTVVQPEIIDALAPKIAEYANTQNPIQMADFSANDPFQIEFERLSKATWAPDGHARWYYERTRGQYFVELSQLGSGSAAERRFKEACPKHRKLSKIDVAKHLTAWEQLPHQAALGGQKNFVQFAQRMKEAKAPNWRPDERFFKDAIAKTILFNEAARLVGTTQYREVKSQFAAYVVAVLAFRTGGQIDLSYIWQQQRISRPLEDLILRWIAIIGEEITKTATEQSRGPGEWCKRSECWKRVQRLDLPPPVDGTPEFERVERTGGSWGAAPTETRVALDPDEMDARQRCRQVEAPEWIRIVEWGTRSGVLEPKQREIAVELGGAAATGWTRDIPAKKAFAGREIINAAIANGVLEEETVA
jgi:hypothetical protein